jgi:electron transport complex protein RnfD
MNDASSPGVQSVAARLLTVGSSPHLSKTGNTTQRMMTDVLIALIPVLAMSFYIFGWYLAIQIGICVATCLVGEALFSRLAGQKTTLGDCSAVVTGVILGLSLPWSAPWYVAVVAALVSIGIGKIVFGGIGFNIFNPAMVGRAFAMLSYAKEMGASAYVKADASINFVTQATPLTAAKAQATADLPGLWTLFLGTHNGSLGETSILASLIGGLYLCYRRAASWEIPVAMILAVLVCAGGANLAGLTSLTALHHLATGALLFGAFFIATDPVTSPVTPKGKYIFGAGIGVVLVVIRVFSGYAEGLMFAVLLMNGTVPLLNYWTTPRPLGGPIPKKA